MIIKRQRGKNEILIALIVVILLLISFVKFTDVKILTENFREKILTYDLGFSRWRNIANNEVSGYDKLISVIEKIPSIIYRNIVGYEREHIDKLEINISFIDYKKILSDRDKAIKNQILVDPQTVNATIIFDGKKYKAKVKLKGDLYDHWSSIYRMSLRINLKGKNTIYGLNEFNIQKPRTRVFPYDAVFQDVVRSSGNLATEHNYVKVVVNGDDWGVMDLESHIGKEYIERNKRKESILVRFSNEEGWHYQNTKKKPANKYYRLSDPILFSKVYGSKKNFNYINRQRYTYVVEQRINKNADLYDIDSYANLLFLSKLWGEMHSLYENNIKHYFNPYLLKIEPISSDQFEPKAISENGVGDVFDILGKCNIGYAFIANEPFQSIKNTDKYLINIQKNYQNAVNKLTQSTIFLKQHHAYFPLDSNINLDVLQKNIAISRKINKSFLEINDKCIDTVTNKSLDNWKIKDYSIERHVQAHHYDNGKIHIYNLLPDNVNILGFRVDRDKFIKVGKEIPGHNNTLYSHHVVDTNLFGILDDKIEIVTEYKGEIKYKKLYKSLIGNVYNPLLNSNESDFAFIKSNGINEWIIPEGVWNVDFPVIIKGNLTILPGTKLIFNNDAYIAINGRIVANGDSNKKILLTSETKPWMGLYVYDSESKSSLKNVIIDNTSSIKDSLLVLSGGVNFYEADVDIDNSTFINTTAEDMLNIVNSDYSITNSTMYNSKSDAIDSDFSNGLINNLIIENVGGDAVDTSGSNVRINNIVVKNVNDKSISAGEGSSVFINDCFFEGVGVGVASKDGSIVAVSNCEIKNAKLASLMTYIKKDFYKSPSLIADSSGFDDDSKFISQYGTSLVVNKIPIKGSDLNVKKLYKTSFMKK